MGEEKADTEKAFAMANDFFGGFVNEVIKKYNPNQSELEMFFDLVYIALESGETNTDFFETL